MKTALIIRKTVLACCFVFCQNASADYLKSDCIGPKEAKTQLVYLHGWDDPNVGSHEKRNRKMFERIASKHNWRIALPRGDGRCSSGQRQCWRVRSKGDLKRSWSRVVEGAKTCFKDPSRFGVVGFSNGGFFTTAASAFCLEPKASYYISVGSAGLGYIPTRSYKNCGPLRFHVGKRDVTRKRSFDLYQRLKPRLKDLRFVTFEGGHIISEKDLVDEVSRLTGSKTPVNP